jgi:hypothetical protein
VILPRGEIVEIVGRLSTGRTSLLLTAIASVTRVGGVAALVDADGVLDPRSAARAGVDGRRLLWVRCDGRRHVALRAVDLLLRCPGFGVVALDLGETAPRLSFPAAFRLRLAARRADTALVILAGRRVAGPGASLTVETTRGALDWAGPPGAPTRLARMTTAVEVLRRRGGLPDEPPPATWQWCA